jgi:hypothetical protein
VIAALTLEDLGFSNEDIAERVIEKTVECLLREFWEDDHGEVDSKPSAFGAAMKKRIIERIDKAIEEIAAKHVLPNVATHIETLCLTETNKWGEKKGEPLTFVEYLVARAEAYLIEKVDSNGKAKVDSDSYGWSGKQTRITHLIHQHLHYTIETAMKAAVKPANDAIAKGIQETVRIQLAEIARKLTVNVSTGR